MSLHGDLLNTARYLLRRNNNRPSGADIRRSISTAYYALFHRMIDAAVVRLSSGPDQQAVLARSFEHGKMKAICQGVRKQPLPPLIATCLGGAAGAELKRFAEVFVALQDRRHDADYSRTASLTKQDGQDSIGKVEAAFADLALIEATPAGQAFLLLGEPKAR